MFAKDSCVATMRLWARAIFAITIAAGVSAAATLVLASDTDSEHLFGFTEGADIGKAGEREAETETIGRFGKGGGSYAAVTQNDQVKWVPVQNFRIGANAALAYFDISGVPGLPDSRLATLQGITLEARADDRLFGAFNVRFDSEATRAPLLNSWPSGSGIGV